MGPAGNDQRSSSNPARAPSDNAPMNENQQMGTSLALFRAALEATSDGFLVVDTAGKPQTCNSRFIQMWGWGEITDLEALARRLPFAARQLKQPRAYLERTRDIAARPEEDSYDLLEFANGRFVERYSSPQRADGKCVGRVWSLRDITHIRQAETDLQIQLRFTEMLIEGIPNPIYFQDRAGHFLGFNRAWENCFGPRQPWHGKTVDDLLPPEVAAQVKEQEQALYQQGGTREFELAVPRHDGQMRNTIFHISTVTREDGSVAGLIGVITDITERKAAEERIRHLAQHDTLTGLPNRALLTDRIGQAIARASRLQLRVAVMFLDLDRFKTINDSLGHQAGDQLLLTTASRLTSCLREGDTVARLGGDEFVVVLPDVRENRNISSVASKILTELALPVSLEKQQLQVSGSIGVALFPEDGADAETLMRKADNAMYHAKAGGRNNFQLFTAEMNASVQHRLQLETSLRQALTRDQFTLHFQPQFDLNSGQIVSGEALIRWNHPHKGMVMPGDFIRLAEEIGLIVPLGDWVLRAVCRHNRLWQDQARPPLRIAINLSARQFSQNTLPETIARALAETGLPPSSLELEITESEMMQRSDETLGALQELHDMGVSISVDDFGTGYSSLSYLKQLPIDRLKIDKSFVRDISTDPDDAAIVSAIIAMAHHLKLKVVAEGVETEEQLAFLRAHRCDEAQGFHLARPMASEEFSRFVGELERA